MPSIMRKVVFSLIFVGVMLGVSLSAASGSNGNKEEVKNRMKIKIGANVFSATLEDNVAATAFKTMLPLSLNMSDLNGNEKYFHFSAELPSEDSNPRTIRAGDLMIWRSRSLVLFYKDFPTSYSYTRLGRIDDASGLADAVGSGNVTITFERH